MHAVGCVTVRMGWQKKQAGWNEACSRSVRSVMVREGQEWCNIVVVLMDKIWVM